MEIIDSFCGIGPWQRRDRLLPYRAGEILGLMDHFGIGAALVHSNFSAGGGSPQRGNLMLREACAKHPRLIPAFTLLPYPYPEAPTLEDEGAAMREAGSKAVWLCPGSATAYPWAYAEILRMCVARRLPVFLHRDAEGLDRVNALCSEFPDLRLILAGVGYIEDWALYPLLRRHPNLHVCLGHYYIPSWGPMRFLQQFPADRLLFGSGLPHFSPGGLVAHVMYADIPEEAREKILSGNLQRLLGEVRP